MKKAKDAVKRQLKEQWKQACNGHTINTGMELDDLKEVLGISFSCSVNEELAHRKKMYKKED